VALFGNSGRFCSRSHYRKRVRPVCLERRITTKGEPQPRPRFRNASSPFSQRGSSVPSSGFHPGEPIDPGAAP
jgi:hypothetical protein